MQDLVGVSKWEGGCVGYVCVFVSMGVCVCMADSRPVFWPYGIT